MRRVPHKRPPTYATSTTRVSYKLFAFDQFVEGIHEQNIIKLKESALFSGTAEINEERMTLHDEIEAAMQRDPWNNREAQRHRRPTLHASIEINEGEGRVTREIEVIWWPNLFEVTKHGQLTLRFFLEKISL